jgi:uncharacterized protein YndB with AHSA1/START domain
MELKFQVQARIAKPVADVFDGVYNPKHLSGYFTKASDGPLAEGTTVHWEFAEAPGAFPVWVTRVVPSKQIVLEWQAGDDPTRRNRVEMTFEALDPGATLVKISESGWPDTQKGLDASYGNCMGWSQMLACMKAYLDHGINLRKGMYDFSKLPDNQHPAAKKGKTP